MARSGAVRILQSPKRFRKMSSYQVLARKWRPHDFESIVGQDHVVTALTRALTEGRLHHAYLFTGTRGVGKTTTCVNLAAALKYLGKRVLLCDFDPQANATSGMGVDKSVSNGVYDVLINGVETRKAIVTTPYGDVLPSSKALAGGGVEMIEMADRQFLLRSALDAVREDYDYIFVDCPPSLELLTLNALCAADSLLVPLQGEYYALEGLSDLMNTVRIVRRNMNPRLQIEGVLLTMFDGRTNLAIQVAQEVKRFFPGKVYATVIPRNIRLSEAPSHGKPITAYDRGCRGAEAYLALANEFLKKNT